MDVEIESDDDNDEDYTCEEYADRDLYESKLDDIDEVLFFSDILRAHQTQNPQMYEFLLSCLDDNEKCSL